MKDKSGRYMLIKPINTKNKARLITVDVEDWFHILETHIPSPDKWTSLPSCIAPNISWIIDNLQEKHNSATFFFLGWVAQQYPQIVRKVSECGFEVASHGFFHQSVDDMNINNFSNDIVNTKKLLEDITGKEIIGYRSPGFTVWGKPNYIEKIQEA